MQYTELIQAISFPSSQKTENLCLRCDVNATCQSGQCICKDGFRGDGFKCTGEQFFLYILVKLYFFVPFVVLKYNKSPVYFVAEDNFNCFYFFVFIISFCSYSALEAIKDPCVPNPCRNNGTCSKGPDESFDCLCPEGFFPPLCTSK